MKDTTQYVTLWGNDVQRSLYESKEPIRFDKNAYEEVKKLTRALYQEARCICVNVAPLDANKEPKWYRGFVMLDRDRNPRQVKMQLSGPKPK